ncbi:lytic murein transglycosylase [Streptomyces sulphureus]|uniref:lytic transglycosylase domain-containing protein n=1 Tax=Streptomyces sulphureus TaxID=47758 RepID=UPI000377DCC0|nr:lytic murein transglycosylase [Streptomyces sulphureus]
MSLLGRRRYGARIRRGTAGTALAVVAVAALTASQAPGSASTGQGTPRDEGPDESWTIPDNAPSDDVYHTELPPLRSPLSPGPPSRGAVERVREQSGIPATVLAAYRKAERSVGRTAPRCRLPWELLAAIGRVESGQARGGDVTAEGTTRRPILGPVLDGDGFARITDTDSGRYDGDRTFDRAVGPMQFIPSTWAAWGADGNGDGRKDPHNIFDAALAAGHYLCAGERDLAVKADLERAVLSYNHSRDYLRTVLSWFEFYRGGAHAVPDGKGALPSTSGAGGKEPRSAHEERKDARKGGKDEGGGIEIGPRPGGGSTPGGSEPSPGPSPSKPDPSEPGEPSPTEPPECETESPSPSEPPPSDGPSTLPAGTDEPCESGEPSPPEETPEP